MVIAVMSSTALRENLRIVRTRAPGARVMAVIKANAYGHGLIGAARALAETDSLAVARVAEAIALRDAGIEKPIVLLEGVLEADELEMAARLNFELVIHHTSQVELLRTARLPTPITVWLKLDSGMNRLGLSATDFGPARQTLAALSTVRQPIRLFTHLANADVPSNESNARQLEVFERTTRDMTAERSICNSAALLGMQVMCGDWVRPGLALYGVSPFADSTAAEFSLRPVMTLRARIIALKEVSAGEQVGYGGTWTASSRTRIAVASIGYGDGYPRSVHNGTPVLIHGTRSPVVGRVSMDMTAIDVSGRDDLRIDDEVTLWGEGLPVEEIAACAGTIPYELLCGVSQRVHVQWE